MKLKSPRHKYFIAVISLRFLLLMNFLFWFHHGNLYLLVFISDTFFKDHEGNFFLTAMVSMVAMSVIWFCELLLFLDAFILYIMSKSKI